MEELKSEIILIRLEPKLLKQLKRYAERNDNGMAARSARKAIKKFLKENRYRVEE